MADGLFIKCCREQSENYPHIEYQEVIVDNACMQLVKNPAQFDVLVMPNLYGELLPSLQASLFPCKLRRGFHLQALCTPSLWQQKI